jgi:hypothetical protein
MIKTVYATWNGEALILDEPLDLKPGTRLWVTLELIEEEAQMDLTADDETAPSSTDNHDDEES